MKSCSGALINVIVDSCGGAKWGSPWTISWWYCFHGHSVCFSISNIVGLSKTNAWDSLRGHTYQICGETWRRVWDLVQNSSWTTVHVSGSKYPCSCQRSLYVLASSVQLSQIQAHTAFRVSGKGKHPSYYTSTWSTFYGETSKLFSIRHVECVESVCYSV